MRQTSLHCLLESLHPHAGRLPLQDVLAGTANAVGIANCAESYASRTNAPPYTNIDLLTARKL